MPVIALHRAVLTRPLDAGRLPALLHPGNPTAQRILANEMRLRASCFWATACDRGCAIRANYQSTTVHLPPALATGNLDIVTDAMVAEVTIGPEGKATGVAYIDKPTGEMRTARARVVMLAASSAESVRILFNSRPAQFPDGVATASGRLGRYIMDTVGTGIGGRIPALENLPAHNEYGAGGNHVHIPWWLYREQHAGRLDFPRGYHVEFGTGRGMPGMDTGGGQGGYGRRYKEDAPVDALSGRDPAVRETSRQGVPDVLQRRDYESCWRKTWQLTKRSRSVY